MTGIKRLCNVTFKKKNYYCFIFVLLCVAFTLRNKKKMNHLNALLKSYDHKFVISHTYGKTKENVFYKFMTNVKGEKSK